MTQAILDSVREVVSVRGNCNVMLTGGATAERCYLQWARTSNFSLDGVRFLFGDERCVPKDDRDSNYALVMRSLFSEGVPAGCSVVRMEADNPDRCAAARAYEELLPDSIDVLLLGMGTDGHVASLFPGSAALKATDRTVVPATAPKPPHERLTITPKVIVNAQAVFLLATGADKGRILAEALKSPEDVSALPVRLARAGTWLLDDDAGRQLSRG